VGAVDRGLGRNRVFSDRHWRCGSPDGEKGSLTRCRIEPKRSVQDVDLSCPGIGNRFRYCDIQRIEINLPHRATGLLLAYALAGDYTYQSSYRHGLHLGSLLALTCIKGLSRGSSSTLALRTLLSTSTGRALPPLQWQWLSPALDTSSDSKRCQETDPKSASHYGVSQVGSRQTLARVQ